MPQSRLIDVNTSAIKRRNEVSAGLDSGNYDKVIGALYSLNALLPEFQDDDGRQKYRITIDNTLYDKFTKHQKFIECPSCQKESNLVDVKIREVMLLPLEALITDKEYDKVWFCPKCHIENRLEISPITEAALREPYFIRVVPKPPLRREGMNDRSAYHKKITQWAWSFMQEWEASMAQFRDDNWQKTNDPLTTMDDIDGGEQDDN